ncbi:U3 snoRNP protein [Geranomyces variabilis]|nr:U3 snoRNP protein [Geranomyces variabilis]
MADQVQFHLEKMVPELEDLQDRGIFSAEEVRSIVKQRTTHEYRIHRIIPLKADYLRYIAYEETLERLRRKRKQRLGMDNPPTQEDIENGVKHSSLSDYSIMRRIHGLYQKLLQKFAGDKTLWIQYFDWCRSTKSTKALGKVFAKAIQLHPMYDTFWVMAAGWEFQDNGNMSSARVLLQRGLRLNPESKRLWVEYFKLELLWVEKIKERRKVLFKSGEHSTLPSAPPAAANSIDVPELDGESSAPSNSLASDPTLSASTDPNGSSDTAPMLSAKLSATQHALLKVLIPRAIYRNAIQAHPKDLAFRLKFLEVYRMFPETRDGQDELFETLIADFPDHAEARAVLCARPVAEIRSTDPSYPAAIKKTNQAFLTTLKELDTAEMHEAYCRFSKEQADACDEENLSIYFRHVLAEAFTKAHSAHRATEALYLLWADFVGETSEGRRKVLQDGVSRIPASPPLWTALIAATQEKESVASLYQQACESVTDADARAKLWLAYLTHLTESALVTLEDIETSADPFARALKVLQTPEHCGPVLALYLETARLLGGIDAGRKLAQRLNAGRVSNPREFWEAWVRLETESLTPAKRKRGGDLGKQLDSAALQRARAAYDGLVKVDTSCESWLAYIRFEIDTARDNQRSTAVHWRAERAVSDKDAFQLAYQEMLAEL